MPAQANQQKTAVGQPVTACFFMTIRGITVKDSFENYVTVADAAARLNIHPESVRRLIRAGKLPARKLANTWLIEKAILEQFASNYDPRPGRKATLL